jgi:NAD(P)-dependent dehydrogenase (short-subunit alcohol dehydrogenase family)
MDIRNTVALVTGANRGLGRAIAEGLVLAGAKKVYAAARDPASITLDGVERLALDVTDAAAVAAAARQAADVNLVVNNAGISRGSAFLAPDAVAAARAELETNFFGPLAMARAFAPGLAAQGGGAIVNVLSVLSWLNIAGAATYSASKSAAWSLTNGLRNELRGQGTRVLAVHVAFMDTDMARHVPGPKAAPADVVRQVLAALAEGGDEVLADDLTRQVKQGLTAGAYLQPR